MMIITGGIVLSNSGSGHIDICMEEQEYAKSE